MRSRRGSATTWSAGSGVRRPRRSQAIDAIPGEVFQARRGPISRDDYLLTRLLELVVHGDDLQRALGRTDAPLLPPAVAAVSDALAAAYVERAGTAPQRCRSRVDPPSRRPGPGRRSEPAPALTTYAAVMPTIHFTVATTSTPEQFVAGLTDFGPGRQELFANSADSSLEVHEQGPGHADVTEGSAGIWERLTYDWSDPNRIVLTTTDSNVFGGRSGHTYTLTRRTDGTTEVDVVVVREGKNLRGRLLSALLGSVGRGLLEKRFKGTVQAIEARNAA